MGTIPFSSFPRETAICPYKPYDIKAFREGNLRFRRCCLMWAGGSFLIGLGVLAFGLFIR